MSEQAGEGEVWGGQGRISRTSHLSFHVCGTNCVLYDHLYGDYFVVTITGVIVSMLPRNILHTDGHL